MLAKQRPPTRRLERTLAAEGFEWVGGLDEVGRGAWAGPVSVGVVVLPEGKPAPRGIRDSKLLTEERREELFPKITQWCAAWAVGHATPVECDQLGMTAALRLAAHRALGGLAPMPQVVAMDGSFDYVSEPTVETTDLEERGDSGDLADAGAAAAVPVREPPVLSLPKVHTVVKGDRTCVSIAAASIVAKVTRDRLMRSMSESFPAFDFDRNKGYPSPVHRTALAGFGLTSLHRRSWSYVDELAFR
jgi:ribonuclease HII